MSEPNWWDQAPVAVPPVETAAVGAPVSPANWWDGAPQAGQPPQLPQAAPPVTAQPEAAEATPATWGETGKDVAKSFGVGAMKGIIGLGSLPGNIEYLARMGIDKGAEFLGRDNPGTSEKKPVDSAYEGRATFMPSFMDYKRDLENRLTGPLYDPKTTLGKYSQTIAEFAPGGVMGRGLTTPQRASRVAVPAVASETAGQLTEGTALEPWARAAGAFTPGTLSRTVTPLPMRDPQHQRYVNVLDAEDVVMSAGQRTNRKPLMWMESVSQDTPFAGGGAANIMREQGETFTQAALRRVGEDSRRATPEVIDRAFTRIGNEFDTVAARNTLRADQRLANDLHNTVGEYQSLVNPSARAPIVEDTINDLVQQFQRTGGALDGAAYQSMRSRLDRHARSARFSDPQLSQALFGIRNSLDDAMERVISPADAAAWRNARNEYRNMLIIEKTVSAPGADAAKGIISPMQLGSKTAAQNQRAYARGQGDFADLAHAGRAVMQPLPQSGTAPRAAAQSAFHLFAGLFGNAAAGPAGAAAAMAAPAASARVLMHPWTQGYLGNQVMTPIQQYLHQPAMSKALGQAPAHNVILNEYGEEPQ